MTERVNRKDQIVEAATQLFIENGYTATSVRQIAEVVGCTEAALYYHFKDGKRALFQEVVECNMPDYKLVLEGTEHATTLAEFVQAMGIAMKTHMLDPDRLDRIRWVIAEYPNLSNEEQAMFQNKHISLHNALFERLHRLVPDEKQAHNLAWTLACAGFGYMKLFYILGMKERAEFDVRDFIDTLMSLAATYVPQIEIK